MMIHRVALVTRPLLLILAALQSAAANDWDWQKHLHELAARDLPVAHTAEEFQRCPDALGVESYRKPSASGWEESGSHMISMGAHFYTWTRYESADGGACIRLNAPARVLLEPDDAKALLRAVAVYYYLQQHPELNPPVPEPRGSVRWLGAEVAYFGEHKPHLRIEADRALAMLSATELQGILSSEPPMTWLCQSTHESRLDCAPHGPPPFATSISATLAHQRIRGADGAESRPLEVSFITPRPSMMAELLATDQAERPQIELLAPMDLTLESIRHAVRVSVDDVDMDLALQRSTLTRFRDRSWHYNANPDDHEPRNARWNAEPRFAWRVELPEIRPGQTLAVRLRAGLRTPNGPLSNYPEDPEGDLLLTWVVPTQANAQASCGHLPQPDYPLDALLDEFFASIPPASSCPAEYGLAMYFDTQPTAETLAALERSLPTPLRLDPAGLKAVHADPRFRQQHIPVPASTVFRLALLGAKPDQHYRLPVQGDWRDIHGAAFAARTLQWSTSDVNAGAFAPERMTFRRAARNVSETAGQNALRPKLRLRRGDGSRSAQSYAWPVAPPITPSRLGLPSTEVLWATGQQIADSKNWIEPPDIVIAVTELGLHGLILGDQLLAVVTDLDSGGPIVDCQVELRSEADSMVTARTAADGTAWLTFTAEQRKLQPVLVARCGDRQAVMGIRTDQALRLHWLLPRDNHAKGTLLFTDKQSYQPGEPVRFWMRSVWGEERRWRSSQEIIDRWGEFEPAVTIHAYDDIAGPVSTLSAIPVETEFSISASIATPELADAPGYTLVALGGHATLRRTSALPWTSSVLLDQAALIAGEATAISIDARDIRAMPLQGRLATATAMRIDQRYGSDLDSNGRDQLRSRFPDFRFVDPWLGGSRRSDPCATSGNSSQSQVDLGPTDVRGESRGQLRMPLSNCEFAEVDLSVQSRSAQFRSERGPLMRRLLARHPRYLGLSGLAGPRAAVGTQFDFQTIAVEVAQLAERKGVPIVLTVHSQEPSHEEFRCQMRSGEPSACRWRATRKGTYQIALESEGYSTTRFSLRVGPGSEDPPGRSPARLWVADSGALRPTELALDQPYPAGHVLLLLNDQHWRGAQWFELQGGVQRLSVKLPDQYSGCVHALALVIPASPPGTAVEPIDHARTQLCLDPPSAELVALTLDPVEGRDGRIRLTVRSTQQQTVTLNLTVFEDLSATQGPTRLTSGELTHCFHFSKTAHAEPPQLHSLQAAEVWRNPAQQLGRGEATPRSTVHTGSSERCHYDPRRSTPEHVVKMPIPTRQRNLLWQPEITLEAGDVREFTIDLPEDSAEWLVELLAVDEALRVQSESRSLSSDRASPQRAE